MEVFPLGHQPLSGLLCRVIGIVKSSAQQLAKHEHLLILLQLPEMVVHGLNAIPNMLEGWLSSDKDVAKRCISSGLREICVALASSVMTARPLCIVSVVEPAAFLRSRCSKGMTKWLMKSGFGGQNRSTATIWASRDRLDRV